MGYANSEFLFYLKLVLYIGQKIDFFYYFLLYFHLSSKYAKFLHLYRPDTTPSAAPASASDPSTVPAYCS
jgi:hypothetical protein